MMNEVPSGDGSTFNIDILSPVKALTDAVGEDLSTFRANERASKYFEALDWYDGISVERFSEMSPVDRWTLLNRVDGFVDLLRCQEIGIDKALSQLARERLNFLWVAIYPLELADNIPQVYREAVKRLREKIGTPMLINIKGEG